MSTIEIISHCWNGHLKIYAPMLRAQGLSLIDHSHHHCKVVWSICYNHDDEGVIAVLDELKPDLISHGIEIQTFPFSLERLFQRSIGRNMVALSSTADCVWFCDCDYLFSGGCLDSAVLATAQTPDSIVYPHHVLVTSHLDGDNIIKKMEGKAGLTVDDMAHFQSRHEVRAIGGIQIVSGELARSKGYLDGTKWQQPVTNIAAGFFQTGSDVRYRKSIGKVVPQRIPEVRRIRHSRHAYNGTVVDPQ